MPRPKKCRRICALPRCSRFGPLDGAAESQVALALEELEAIRLLDLLGCTQEECAEQMGVARSTVQQVYDAARRKLALAPGGGAGSCGGRRRQLRAVPPCGGCAGRDCARRDCHGALRLRNLPSAHSI